MLYGRTFQGTCARLQSGLSRRSTDIGWEVTQYPEGVADKSQTKTSIHEVAWDHPKDAGRSICTLALGDREASQFETSVHEIAKDAEARTIPARN